MKFEIVFFIAFLLNFTPAKAGPCSFSETGRGPQKQVTISASGQDVIFRYSDIEFQAFPHEIWAEMQTESGQAAAMKARVWLSSADSGKFLQRSRDDRGFLDERRRAGKLKWIGIDLPEGYSPEMAVAEYEGLLQMRGKIGLLTRELDDYFATIHGTGLLYWVKLSQEERKKVKLVPLDRTGALEEISRLSNVRNVMRSRYYKDFPGGPEKASDLEDDLIALIAGKKDKKITKPEMEAWIQAQSKSGISLQSPAGQALLGFGVTLVDDLGLAKDLMDYNQPTGKKRAQGAIETARKELEIGSGVILSSQAFREGYQKELSQQCPTERSTPRGSKAPARGSQ